jgi:hypothetical protein
MEDKPIGQVNRFPSQVKIVLLFVFKKKSINHQFTRGIDV